ncbi:TPA: M48 family metallopeptidase [Clostridium perfringens]|uniref:M48 family metallopeptidase n=1 Tax=Clostridium perfringens TaxID=1502 RepID=UPI001898755F|nr:M48 family metallopeptidase [Clostridium perfringens]MDH5099475.1 hypothetical protein [Clostridium perfringens]MDK0917006.1 M48 family metallopeptidase [Clostridium perfringens]MDU3376662.1 M48 family metallopeptidase [Clostridium perfringens]MDU3535906.1 M48 family metallopeptidase [Clostridium perfringens]MDV5102927.1 M48 family metallopeptidase [Clostridium perfringens]
MLNKEKYIHKLEEQSFEEMINSSYFSESIMNYYKNFEEKMRKPDLLGKTVKVSKKQFPDINICVCDICKRIGIESPEVYIYEDFYYGVESKGSDKPWIEISAKTVEDFSIEELKFLIAREICSINLKHTYYKTLIDQTLNTMEESNFVIGIDTFTKTIKASVYKWYRIINYTCDNFGYLMCNDLKTCINAILKTILNSSFLVENINVSEYLNQSIEINKLNDTVYNFTKADEKVPYGPFRIKNLLAFSSSKRAIEVIKEEI